MKVQRHESDRDRFELLSAYFDGEITPRERRQVQQWLDSDTEVQCLYRRLLKLRQGIQGLPVPATTRSTAEVTANVLRTIERRRIRRLAILGGGAIAAAMVAAVSLFLPGDAGFAPRMARTPESQNSLSSEMPDEALLVALDRPVVSIPPATDTLTIPLDRPVVEIPKAAAISPKN
ncbi:MAG: zf-HC2 domain-containing protein [Cyanobacteria bacterium SBLK]|nr:zf-HC2 domain-containing protein [Cyanobacteria bacterium SBLK]